MTKGCALIRKLCPLDETHLDVVRGLIGPRGFAQWVNKESLPERHNWVQLEQIDVYAYAKDLIHSGRI